MDVLPSSRPTKIVTTRHVVNRGIAGMWEPVYCANCGKDEGLVPEDAGFAFVLCNDCYAHHGVPAGLLAVPDEVFWRTVQEAQMEEFGRLLTPEEEAAELANPDSRMSLIARDQKAIISTSRG